MKRVLSGLLQFILFLAVFFLGSIAPAFGIVPSLQWALHSGRIFVYDGVLLTLALYVLILLIAAIRKRLPVSLPTSTIALVLALILGLLMKFGFKSL